MLRKGLLFICLLSISVTTHSQHLSGYLTDKKDKKPISYAIVQLVEEGLWTIASEDGYFSFTDIKEPQATLFIRHLGMQEFSQTFRTLSPSEQPLLIELTPQSYDMQEVTVIAKKGQGTSTSSVIDKEAIDHIQPTTLADIMQLLPGNLIENPDVQDKQTISIRDIDDETNSALGVGIYIDGTPATNDGNYQTYSTTNSTSETTSLTSTTEDLTSRLTTTYSNGDGDGTSGTSAGESLDMRQISTDNIESVEVLKGIPSVKYGNLTSGVVLVNRKSGRTPIEAKVKSDPKIKQVYVGKGISLKKGASLNIDADYTKSYNDIRSEYTSYKRITGRAAYTNTFFKTTTPLSIKAGISAFQTIDKVKTDPDAQVADEQIKESETSMRFNINGDWMLKKSFITNLKGKFLTSVNIQDYYAQTNRSTGIEPISTSLTAGENEGIYLPSESLTELTIKGLPVTIFGNLIAEKHFSNLNNGNNTLLYGIEYCQTGNYGQGRIYDISNPPTVSNTISSRPRSFSDIPAMQYYALFIEDKHKQPIGNTTLTTQAGIRLNNFQPSGVFQSDVGFRLEPRLNINFKLYNASSTLVKLIEFHGGLGLNFKAPPIFYLYPDKAYFDLVSLTHYTGDSETNMVYFTTFVFETENESLKPSKNFKKEIGLEFKIGSVKGDITAFHENLSDGFGFLNKYQFVDYRVYDDASVEEGEKPIISSLPYDSSTYIVKYSYPVNNKQKKKYGIEYSFDFGRLDALATKITMNGAWLHTHRIYSTSNYEYLPEKTSGQYEEIGVYSSGEGRVKERLNTSFRFITHSTKLRLIFTTTVQTTWYEKIYYTYYDESPLYLYSRDNDYIEFTDDMKNSTDYNEYVTEKSDSYYYTELMPPLFLFNFKLSKEIYDIAKLSFYVNNFFNYRPMYQYKRSYSYLRRNPSIYFGADLTIKI